MKLKRGIWFALFAAGLLTETVLIGQKPYYNWDMFPYMALAMRSPTTPFDSTHANVYKTAAATLSHSDFVAVSSRQPVLMSDPLAFEKVLKYFEIKPLYLITVRALCGLGVNPVAATYLPSVASYFFIGCILFWWLFTIMSPARVLLITWITMAYPFLVDTARYSSPDMLCALVLLIAVYLIMAGIFLPALIVLWLAVLVRPDAAILALIVSALLFRSGRISTRAFTSAALSGMIITLLLTGRMIAEFLFTTADYSPQWTLRQMMVNYSNGLIRGLPTLWSPYLLAFTLLAAITIYLRIRVRRLSFRLDLWVQLVTACLASIIVRYLLHPFMEDRFLVAVYLVIAIAFFASLPPHLVKGRHAP